MGRAGDVVELLLANKAEVNAKINDGQTPLHTAARWGRRDVVELLLAYRAEVNARNNDGLTPLNAAAESGHMDVVNCCLSTKAEVNTKDNGGPDAFARGGGIGPQGRRGTAAMANGAEVNGEGKQRLDAFKGGC